MDSTDQVGADHRSAQHLILAEPVGLGLVVHRDTEPVQPAAHRLQGRGDAGPDLPAFPHEPAPDQSVGVADLLGAPAGGGGDVPGEAAGEPVQPQPLLVLDLDGLVPAEPALGADAQLGDVDESVGPPARRRVHPLGTPLLDLQEPQVEHHLGSRVDSLVEAQQALHGQVGILPGAGPAGPPRSEHAELPARPVLARRGPVRIQQVTLVEHGIGHRARQLDAHPTGSSIGSPTRPAPASRASIVASAGGQAVLGLEADEGSEHVPVEAQPAGVRIVELDHLLPDRYGQRVGRLAVPRHLFHPEPVAAPGEDRAGEQQRERDRAFPESVQVLRPGDLEVVGARQRQVDVAGAGEALHHRGALHPHEGSQRVPPPGPAAEQGEQARLLGLGVAAALRLDPDLAAQRDGVDLRAGRLLDPQPGGQLRRHRVRLGHDVEHAEPQPGHRATCPSMPAGSTRAGRARAATAAKNSSIDCRTSVPPSKPRHSRRSCPTNS